MPPSNVFDEMRQFWAEIADKNQTQIQLSLLKRRLPEEGLILDVACGTGRHTIPLTQDGYVVVGLDVSLNLLKIAKQRGAAFLVRGDMQFLPFKQDTFTAAFSMDTSFGYLPSEEADRHSLAEVRRVLICGGLFVLDVFNREHIINKYASGRLVRERWEYPSFFLEQERSVSENGGKLYDRWDIYPKDEGQIRHFEHGVRLYQPLCLAELLTSAGFVVSATFGGYEEQQFSSTSSRLIIVANAK